MPTKFLHVVLAFGVILTACNSAIAPTATPTNTPKPTSTPTPFPTATPTPLPPAITVKMQATCYAGPGIAYDPVTTLEVGDEAEVAGKDTDGVYWIVKNPNGEGECWVEGKYVEIGGETNPLVVMSPPPTPTPAVPSAPSNISATVLCTLDWGAGRSKGFKYLEVIIILIWEHDSHNTDGYNIYKYEQLIGTIDANTREFKDLYTTSAWNTTLPITRYAIEAFNSVGSSPRVEYIFNSQCTTIVLE